MARIARKQRRSPDRALVTHEPLALALATTCSQEQTFSSGWPLHNGVRLCCLSARCMPLNSSPIPMLPNQTTHYSPLLRLHVKRPNRGCHDKLKVCAVHLMPHASCLTLPPTLPLQVAPGRSGYLSVSLPGHNAYFTSLPRICNDVRVLTMMSGNFIQGIAKEILYDSCDKLYVSRYIELFAVLASACEAV